MNLRVLRSRVFIALVFVIGVIVPIGLNGQLFPEAEKLQGKVLRIKEKYYGRTIHHFLGIRIFPYKLGYRPNAFSGWKYEYFYDEQNKLIKEIRTAKGKLISKYAFSEDTLGSSIFKRETNLKSKAEDNIGFYTEYEYVLRQNNEVEKVSYWYYNPQSDERYLSIVEADTRYENGLLTHYVRYGVRKDGSIYPSETLEIYYDSLNRVSLIEEWDDGYKLKEMEAPLCGTTSEIVSDSAIKVRKVWKFTYDPNGLLDKRYTECVNTPDKIRDFDKYEISYEYDKHGNWIKWYRKYDDGEKRLGAKRKIKYRK